MHNALKLYSRDNKGTNLSDLAIGYSMRAFSALPKLCHKIGPLAPVG